MAIYAFDGTTCTPSDLSNVFRMYDAYESRHKIYVTGPGSRGTWLSKGIESVTGHGGKDRIHDAYEIWKYWQSRNSRETIIVGFSRGAVIAREFANKICKSGGRIDFLGLYDSVGSFGNPLNMTDVGYRKTIASGVAYCAQALAIDEKRFTFRVIRARAARLNTQSIIKECWFSGIHSDIGGTLKEGIGAATLSWMFEESAKAEINQWNADAVKEAKGKVDCNIPPSKNKYFLPVSLFTSLRTRKIEKNDLKCCEEKHPHDISK